MESDKEKTKTISKDQESNQNKQHQATHKVIGNRMKDYEKSARTYIDSSKPIIARLDGHCFSKFTKGFKKPFDNWLHDLMVKTTSHLQEEYSCDLGYTQSDEITLVFLPKLCKQQSSKKEMEEKGESEKYQDFIFSGQIQKFVSLSAANATNFFSRGVLRMIKSGKIKLEDYAENTQEKLQNPPCYFDCRVFNVPDVQEVKNNLYWRNVDCIKNSISIAAHSYLGHKASDKLNSDQKIKKLLDEKQVDWYTYSAHLKFGTYIKKQLYEGEIEEKFKQYQKDENQTTCIRKKFVAFSLKIDPKNWDQVEFLLQKYADEESLKKNEILEIYDIKY